MSRVVRLGGPGGRCFYELPSGLEVVGAEPASWDDLHRTTGRATRPPVTVPRVVARAQVPAPAPAPREAKPSGPPLPLLDGAGAHLAGRAAAAVGLHGEAVVWCADQATSAAAEALDLPGVIVVAIPGITPATARNRVAPLFPGRRLVTEGF